MKLFVTGATGFIGSHFLNRAISSGIQVIALRRTINSKTRIPLVKEPFWLTKQLDEVTIEDLKGVDVLVHLAAHSMFPPYDTLENCMYYNLMAPIKLFNRAFEAGVEKFVVSGSCFEYGETGENYKYIPVNAALKPTLTYAASKAAASIAFSQFAIDKKIMLSIHRIFHVFGLGESKNRLWPSLKAAAEKGEDFPMSFGEQIRDFVSVNKVVEVLWMDCFNRDIIKGNPIIKNLGTGKPQSVKEFCEYWWEHWNAQGKLLIGKFPYRKGEVMRYVPEIKNEK